MFRSDSNSLSADCYQGSYSGYCYIPAAKKLGVSAVVSLDDVMKDSECDVRSPNGYLFYNSQDHLHQMSQGRYISGDPPKSRLLSLLERTFSHWRDGWMDKQNFPRLPALTHFYDTKEDKAKVMSEPASIRKSPAISRHSHCHS